MITAATATGIPIATLSSPCISRVVGGLDKKCERKMGLELGRDDGRIDLHEEGGDEDEDAGDRRRIGPWLEEQCWFRSTLGPGLDREFEVGLHHRDNDECAAGRRGNGSYGIGHGVGGADGGPSRADSPLFGFGWHWDSPETEILAAPPPSVGLLPGTTTQADTSAPSTAHLSGVPSLSMSLSSTPSPSFMTVSSTAEVVVHGAHVKNHNNSSNQAYSPTRTMKTTTTTPTTVLDGTAKWGRSRSQSSTASVLESAYFHALRPQGPLHQQRPVPTSLLPPSSPPARCQSRVPSMSVISSSMAVVPPLPPSLPSLSSPQPPYAQRYYHPNESSSSYGNHQQQQTQGRGLSLTTCLRSMSNLGNWHVFPTSPASSSAAVVSAGSPPLSALSASATALPSTPIIPGNNKENVSGGREKCRVEFKERTVFHSSQGSNKVVRTCPNWFIFVLLTYLKVTTTTIESMQFVLMWWYFPMGHPLQISPSLYM